MSRAISNVCVPAAISKAQNDCRNRCRDRAAYLRRKFQRLGTE
jgi:hypothetical protein